MVFYEIDEIVFYEIEYKNLQERRISYYLYYNFQICVNHKKQIKTRKKRHASNIDYKKIFNTS